MEPLSKVYWLWLGFSKIDEDYLLNIQKYVQGQFKSPRFDIHLTLDGPFEDISNNFIQYLIYLSKTEYSFCIETDDFRIKNLFFESIFISLKKTDKLNKLREKFKKYKNKDLKAPYHPHISLAYGDYKESDKKNIISNLPELKSNLKITKLFIVEVDEKKLVWKKVHTFNLLKN